MASLFEEGEPSTVNSGRSWRWGGGHGERMRNLLETGFLSDSTLFVGASREPFRVHRLLLESGSPVFHEMFKSATNNELAVPDVESSVFSLFLRHLYVGDSDNVDDSYFKETEVLALLKLGSDFQVTDLTDICARILKNKLCDENVVDVFQKSMECGHKELIQSSLVYFCRNGWKLVEAEEFVALRQECLYEILKQDDLMVHNELQLYNSLIRWGEAECDRQKIEPGDSENIRKVLQKLLGLIRFPMMEQADFTLNVALKNILGLEELVSILLYFTVPIEQRSAIPPGRFNSSPRNYYVDEAKKPVELPSASQPADNRMIVYRYDTSLTPKWKLVKQKREVLWFEVMSGEPVNLVGFIWKLSRDPIRAIQFKDNWTAANVNFSVIERDLLARVSDKLIMSGTINVDSSTWEFKFHEHVLIYSRKYYSLTVHLAGFVKAQSKSGPVRNTNVNELMLEAGVGYEDAFNSQGPPDFKINFWRRNNEKLSINSINQGFIDALIFS